MHLYTDAAEPTVEPLKLSGIQCSDGVRHAGWFADSAGVDSSNSEVVRVSFKQPRHWVFTDLYGVIIALGPVFSTNLTSKKKWKQEKRGEEFRRGDQSMQGTMSPCNCRYLIIEKAEFAEEVFKTL